MEVTINGEKASLEAPLNITELLSRLGVDTRQAAVERNRKIVPKSLYAATRLTEGDAIEIVGFIGGG